MSAKDSHRRGVQIVESSTQTGRVSIMSAVPGPGACPLPAALGSPVILPRLCSPVKVCDSDFRSGPMGRDDAESGLVQLSAFCTPIGWIGLVGLRQTLVLVSIGHKTKDGLMKRVAERLSQQTGARPGAVADWNPELRDRIERYCEGEIVDFSDVTIPLSDHTLFAQAVLRAVRGVRYGQTRTYGQIATKVAAPRAARAVGRVLAANRFPLIVPCHRVVAATGRLGGFSAPRGIELKRQLLQMEAAHPAGTAAGRSRSGPAPH